ncbi:MAG: hypothetical protein BA871_05975 [Desulfuromonadales bacterium C00003096]|jgi:hypothetical protein|nr:MAG: hypothetical protein BA871_05975 [Desulfuromonadales bacterium C00003096]
MTGTNRIPLALLCLRLGVFLVMLLWTLDKFRRPEHAAAVFANFYFIGGLGSLTIYLLGTLEIFLLIGFVAGVKKRLTYGAVLLLHGISTLSSFKQYLAPFEGPNLLFFAAWPMLAACLALYLLRDLDTLCTVEKG